MHPHDAFADSLRLSATPMTKSYDSLRLCALLVHAADYWVVQQAAVGGLLHDPAGAVSVHVKNTPIFHPFLRLRVPMREML